MAYDPATYKVNLDTPQPDGRKGESPRNAFTKYNALVDALKNAPPAPASTTTNKIPQWSNTTGALKDGLAVTSSNTDETVGKLMVVGDFGVGDNGISVDPSTNPGSGFYRSAVYPTPDGATGNYYYLHYRWSTASGYGWELASNSNGNTLLYRALVNGTYTSPEEIIHTGNTGLIVSSGSNANGNWVQFADGTQMCMSASAPETTSNVTGNNFVSGTITFTYPKSFTSTPYIATSCDHVSGITWVGRTTNRTSSGFGAVIFGGGSSHSGSIRYIATGRWK